MPCSILMGVPQILIGVLLGFFLAARRRMKQKSVDSPNEHGVGEWICVCADQKSILIFYFIIFL